MVDHNTPGDKKLSVPSKTLTLKPRVETGTVRQSFPHGRTKQVVVEKRGKRRIGGDGPSAEVQHATPEPVAAKAVPATTGRPAASPPPAAPARNTSGVVGVRLVHAVRRREDKTYPDWRWIAFWPGCPNSGGIGWSVNKYGDERAFVALVERYQGAFRRIAQGLSPSTAVATRWPSRVSRVNS